jgi:hypothetical protein
MNDKVDRERLLADLENDAPQAVADESEIEISLGDTLNSDAVDAFLRQRKATIVSLVGEPNTGKTTLVSIVYELIRRARFSSLVFAGSETLRGFERRCHLSRIASERETPDTEHTPKANPVEYLHLRALVSDENYEDFLLADRSGELFSDVVDEPAKSKNFIEISKCNVVCILVDGAQLIDNEKRALHLTRIRRLMRAFSEQGALPKSGIIQIVLTKFDALGDDPENHPVLTQVNAIVKEVEARDGGLSVKFYKVAARPTSATQKVELGHGIEQLVLDWIRPVDLRDFKVDTPTYDGDVPFNRLLDRNRESQ